MNSLWNHLVHRNNSATTTWVWLLVVCVIKVDYCHSLSSRAPVVLPKASNVASQLVAEDGGPTTKLDYKVAVGNPENPFQFQDLQVELLLSKQQNSNKWNKNAVANGTAAATTGWYDTKFVDDKLPTYINLKGQQRVKLQDGCWKILWKPNTPHGFFICSFDVPKSVQRNNNNNNNGDNDAAATLPAGRFFMYHRIWSKQTLEIERSRRKFISNKAAKHLYDRDQLVKKLIQPEDGDDNNLLNKVKTYGQAFKAKTKYDESGYQGVRFVPLYDEQVLQLTPESGDCILSTRGKIYREADWLKDRMVNKEDILFLGEKEGMKMAYMGESRVDFLVEKE